VKILKLGGSCLAGPDDYAALEARAEAEGARVVVVSALQGVTDALCELVDAAERRAPADPGPLAERHRALLRRLEPERRRAGEAGQRRLLDELRARLAAIAAAEAPCPWSRDAVLGLGERLSLVAAMAHARGPARAWVAGAAGIVTTPEPGRARILFRGAALARERLARGPGLDLVAGYVGEAEDGRWTTLGRGGSDVTAVFLAWALDGEAVLLKDVPGLLSADPALVPAARLLDAVEPAHAIALARGGCPVVAQSALEMCRERAVRLRICPWWGSGGGTVIAPGGTDRPAMALAPAGQGDPGTSVLTVVGHGVEAFSARGRATLAAAGIESRDLPAEAGVLRLQVPSSQGRDAALALHALWAI
jgi:aspartokinase/homoserine dehydrogenase 1